MSHDPESIFLQTATAPLPDEEQAGQPLDKRIIGERNRSTCLMWLHRFGWLTSRQLASLAWGEASQAWPMARRTLKALQDDGLVIRRALPQGGDAYLLSAKGARLLTEQAGVDARSGQGLALGNPVHRACSNWYLIDAIHSGMDVVTEHEIASDRGPVRVLDGKQADGILLGDGEAIWLECENAWKATKSRRAVVEFCARHLDQPTMTMLTPDHGLRQVAIVSTNMDALRHMAATFQQAFRAGEVREAQLQMVNVALLPVSRSLVPSETVSSNLWELIILQSESVG